MTSHGHYKTHRLKVPNASTRRAMRSGAGSKRDGPAEDTEAARHFLLTKIPDDEYAASSWRKLNSHEDGMLRTHD